MAPSYIIWMDDLFGFSPVPGFNHADAVFTTAEEVEFIARIDAEDLSPFRFQGWTGKRLTRSFGWNYDFDTARLAQADPIPDWLLPARDRVAALAGLEAGQLVQALLIRYDAGAGIGWHRDRPVFDHVAGISLGNAATLRLRRRLSAGFERASVHLAPRSIYHLSGTARHDWEHSIAPMEVPRWSITFRSLSDKGRQILQR